MDPLKIAHPVPCRMNAYIQFLTTKASNVENVPHRIRGRVMHLSSDLSPSMLHASLPDGTDVCMHVGLDAHSCTASAAAMAFWLSPPASLSVPARTLRELAVEHKSVRLDSLTSDAEVSSMVVQPLFSGGDGGTDATLLVVSTAPHKFAVLRVGDAAMLLQSNQDDTRGGQCFTLSDWLRGGGVRLTPEALSEMIRQLASAAVGVADHESVFSGFFGGARFKRGDIDDYWVTLLPVTMDIFA